MSVRVGIQFSSFIGCILASVLLVFTAGLLSFNLPRIRAVPLRAKLTEAEG
jgi:hypothetical protein